MDDLTARDLMTAEVITLSPDATLREAAELLVERRIGGAPVVEGDGRVVGIVSETDLIDPEKRRVRLPRTALFGVYLVPEKVLREAFDEGESLTVREVMTRHAFTLPEDAPAGEVAAELVGRKINRIPITRGGKLVGIVTRADVLRAMGAYWQRRPAAG